MGAYRKDIRVFFPAHTLGKRHTNHIKKEKCHANASLQHSRQNINIRFSHPLFGVTENQITLRR